MIRHVIWDIDGTLFDTYPAIAAAFDGALAHLGTQVPREGILGLARQSLSHCVETLAAQAGTSPEAFGVLFERQYASMRPQDQPPFPGAREACEYIVERGGLNLIVSHRARASVEGLLSAHGLGSLFAAIIGGDDGFARKPDPAAFVALIARFELPRTETLAIGDREIDILGGRAAGLRTCFFGEASASTADRAVRDYREFMHLLAAENREGTAART